VCISGVSSSQSKVTCEIPQRSVLGPFLFLIYINDIGNSVPGACVKFFADDTNLFVFSNDVIDLQIDVSEKLILLSNWFIANMLSLSINTTCYSVFGAGNDKTNIKLKIGDIILKEEECSKYLGVIIDSNLTWQNHIDYI